MIRTGLRCAYRRKLGFTSILRPHLHLHLHLHLHTNPVSPLPLHTVKHAYATASKSLPQVKLRDYQQACIDSVLSAYQHGKKRVGVSLATGAGKTVVFTQMIGKVPPRSDYADRTLILAHRRELVEQAASHCQRAYPNKRIEIDMGNIHASGIADITIASVPSLISKNRLDKYDPSTFKLVLVDEAHHIVAPGHLKVLEHFGLSEKKEDSPFLVGVSATFSRFDGLRLGAAIDEIVYHRDYVEMISEKWLSDVIFTTVESTANLAKVKSGNNGDFATGDLSRAVNVEKINKITVNAWQEKAAGRKSTLVFCVDLAHVDNLTRTFRKYGYDARFVTGDTPKQERSQILQDFKDGVFPVLLNCSVFTEGTDIPNIDCIILARPTRSQNLLIQMIGRGMRLHPDKKNCHIIDLVATLSEGIVTTPTLFGLDPNELLTSATPKDMEKRKKENEEKLQSDLMLASQSNLEARTRAKDPTITFTDYDSVIDLIADTSGERHIRSLSDHAWVHVGTDRFILSSPNHGYLRIERIPADEQQPDADSEATPTYRTVEVRALPPEISRSPWTAPRQILTALTFSDAVHGADNYACKNYPRSYIHLYQPWRKQPASQTQLDFINKARGAGRALRPEEVNKGKAADMITKLKHGARGRFSKVESAKKRITKEVQKREERMSRERVRVGPVAA